MAERPILFSAPMVRAILNGTKTQTRRVVKLQPFVSDGAVIRLYDETATHMTGRRCWQVERPGEYDGQYVIGNRDDSGRQTNIGRMQFCVGDRLWVREAYRFLAVHDHVPPRELSSGPVWFEAQDEVPFHPSQFGKLRPSMFMPRWASRITLEVTGVRVERLQDISEADAMAEGAPSADLASGSECIFPHQGTHRWGFRLLWESINGRPKLPINPASRRYARVKRWLEKHPDTTSWDANPWVWVVSFKRVEVSNG